jgi:hypothetical protein
MNRAEVPFSHAAGILTDLSAFVPIGPNPLFLALLKRLSIHAYVHQISAGVRSAPWRVTTFATLFHPFPSTP